MIHIIYLLLALLLVSATGAFADEGIIVGKEDALVLSISEDKASGRFVLSISAKVGKRVVTSRQNCKSKEECEGIKKSLESTHKGLKTDEKLALQLQETQTVAKVVKETGTPALAETLVSNFPIDGVVDVSLDGLMTNQKYSSGRYYCQLRASDAVLVKNNGVMVVSDKPRSTENYQCEIPVNHSHITSILCYAGGIGHRCDDMTLAGVNAAFNNRLSFYFPATKVVHNSVKGEKNKARVASEGSGGEDSDATLKTVDKSHGKKSSHKAKEGSDAVKAD